MPVVRLVLFLSLFAGCSTSPPAQFTDLDALPFPVPTEDPTEFWTLSETPLQTPRSTATWGVLEGVWSLAVDGPGLDANYEPVRYQPPVLTFATGPDDEPTEHPLPPFFDGLDPRETFAKVGELVGTPAIPSVSSDPLVIVYDDVAWILDDSGSWHQEIPPPQPYAAWVWTGDAFRTFDDDGFSTFDGEVTRADVQEPDAEGFGWLHTMDAEGGWATWTDQERFCASRVDFDGTLATLTCRTFGFRTDRASTVVGTPDEAWVLLDARSSSVDYRQWVRITPTAIEDSGLAVPSRDLRGYDARPSPETRATIPQIAEDIWMDPQTGEAWLAIPTGQPIDPAEGCSNTGETAEDRARTWCMPRSVEPRRLLGGSPYLPRALYVDNHDGTQRLYVVEGPAVPADVPLVAPGTLPDDVDITIPTPLASDGTPLPDECLAVRNESGVEAPRNADGTWSVPVGGVWRATVGPCDVGDGGPPVLYASRVIDETAPVGNLFPEVLRAWPLDGVVEPVQQVVHPEVDAQVVLLDTGWHALFRSDDGLDTLFIDDADAAAPAILPGPLFLTESGDLLTPDGTTHTIPLVGLPEDVRVIDQRFMVDEGANWLVVADLLAPVPQVLIEESVERSGRVVDLSHDGEWVVEQSTGRVDVRHIATDTSTRVITYAQGNEVHANVSEAGDYAIASSTEFFPSTTAEASLDTQTGNATVTTLCSYCGLHAWFEEGEGRWRVVDGVHEEWDGQAWQTLMTLPMTREVVGGVDPFGYFRVTFDGTFDARGVAPVGPYVSGTLVEGTWSWLHSPPSTWYRITGPGEYSVLSPDPRDLGNGATPLHSGRAAKRIDGNIHTGDWSPVWPNIIDPTDWGSAVLYTPPQPFQASRVCQIVSTQSGEDAERRFGCVY